MNYYASFFVDYRLDVNCPALPFGGFCLCVCEYWPPWAGYWSIFFLLLFLFLVSPCLVMFVTVVESAFVLYNWMCVCVHENACGERKVNARILLIPNGMQRNTIH